MLWASNNHFLPQDVQAKLMALLKKRLNFHQNQIWESNACEGENLQVLYIMNLVSLVTGKFKITTQETYILILDTPDGCNDSFFM